LHFTGEAVLVGEDKVVAPEMLFVGIDRDEMTWPVAVEDAWPIPGVDGALEP
jgi:hypothetical protein